MAIKDAIKYLRETRKKFKNNPFLLSVYEPSAIYMVKVFWDNRHNKNRHI